MEKVNNFYWPFFYWGYVKKNKNEIWKELSLLICKKNDDTSSAPITSSYCCY